MSMKTIETLYIEEERYHIASIEVAHPNYSFQIYVTAYDNIEDIKQLYIEVKEKDNFDPVFMYDFPSDIPSGQNQSITPFFSFPNNSGFKPPYTFYIYSSEEDIDLSKYTFEIQYKSLLA